MSSFHNLPLEEIPTPSLRRELERRHDLLQDNKCPYCKQLLTQHTCKFANETGTYSFYDTYVAEQKG